MEDVAPTPSEPAARGTVIHAMGANMCRDGVNTNDYNKKGCTWGQVCPEIEEQFASKPVTQDMIGIATQYHSKVVVMQWALAKKGGVQRDVEKKVGHKDVFGRADVIFTVKDNDDQVTELVVVDLKTGIIPVSPENNTQLSLYAALHMEDLQADMGLEVHCPVTLVVIQSPEDGAPLEVNRCTTSPSDVKRTLARFRAAMESDRLAMGDHCQYCPARSICPEQRKAMGLVRPVGDMDGYTPDQWAQLLDNLPQIRKTLKSIEDRAKALVEEGYEVPGYKLVEKVSNLQWHDEAEARSFLAKRYPGKKLLNPGSLRTPTQLSKELKAGQIIDQLSGRQVTGTVLVPESDKREPVLSHHTLMDDGPTGTLFTSTSTST